MFPLILTIAATLTLLSFLCMKYLRRKQHLGSFSNYLAYGMTTVLTLITIYLIIMTVIEAFR